MSIYTPIIVEGMVKRLCKSKLIIIKKILLFYNFFFNIYTVDKQRRKDSPTYFIKSLVLRRKVVEKSHGHFSRLVTAVPRAALIFV